MEKYGVNANYIRADRTCLEFTSTNKKKIFSLADILSKKVALRKIDTEPQQHGAPEMHQTQLSDDEEPMGSSHIEGSTDIVEERQFGEHKVADPTQLADESSHTATDDSSTNPEQSEGAEASSEIVTSAIEVTNISTPSITLCPFCMVMIEKSDSTAVLTEKGVTSILAAAKQRKETGMVCKAEREICTSSKIRLV